MTSYQFAVLAVVALIYGVLFLVMRPLRIPAGWVLVPREPTAAMLAGACSEHKPGEPMNALSGECPYIEHRRNAWRQMLDAAL